MPETLPSLPVAQSHMTAVFDDFADEEWVAIDQLRITLDPLPDEVDGFLGCQQLTEADMQIRINAR